MRTSSSLAASDAITGLAHGLYKGWLAELGAQPADGCLDRGGEGVCRLVPDGLEQLLGGHDGAGVRQEMLEDGEHLGAGRAAGLRGRRRDEPGRG